MTDQAQNRDRWWAGSERSNETWGAEGNICI